MEGINRNPQIKYQKFIRDELVLVCNSANHIIRKESIKPEELKSLPMLMREPGSGSLDVIPHALKQFDIKIGDLQTEMQLGGTESIKSYLLNSNCFAFLSVQSVLTELKTNTLKVIDIKDLTIERPFYFIQPQGQASPLADLFLSFAKTHNRQ